MSIANTAPSDPRCRQGVLGRASTAGDEFRWNLAAVMPRNDRKAASGAAILARLRNAEAGKLASVNHKFTSRAHLVVMSQVESHFSDSSLPLFAFADAAPLPPKRADHASVAPESRNERLRDRFREHGALSFADDELLELVLSPTLPQGEASAVVRSLLARFGDFNGVISASASRLRELPGITPAAVTELKLVEAAAHRLARTRAIRRSVISSWDALLDYCRTTMAHRETEHFRVLFLDRQNTLIADEEQGKGTVNHVPVYPREVAKRALELNASALILVHNHPSGDPTPSQSDIAMTGRIRDAIEALDITLHDHLVIGRAGEVSFRDAGLL